MDIIEGTIIHSNHIAHASYSLCSLFDVSAIFSFVISLWYCLCSGNMVEAQAHLLNGTFLLVTICHLILSMLTVSN